MQSYVKASEKWLVPGVSQRLLEDPRAAGDQAAADDLQDRFQREIASRDADIVALREQLEQVSDRTEENARIASLGHENEHLKKQLEFCRTDYEGKIERLNNRVRELSGKIGETKAPEPAKGLFRR